MTASELNDAWAYASLHERGMLTGNVVARLAYPMYAERLDPDALNFMQDGCGVYSVLSDDWDQRCQAAGVNIIDARLYDYFRFMQVEESAGPFLKGYASAWLGVFRRMPPRFLAGLSRSGA